MALSLLCASSELNFMQFLGELWTSWCGSYSAKVVPMKAEKITFTEGLSQAVVIEVFRPCSQEFKSKF